MKRKDSGFTLVEIMIVVAVIAILAGIIIVGYGAWRKSASENVVKSDLTVLFAKMESVRQATNQYPTSVPSDVQKNNTTTFTYVSGDATTYCIQGQNSGNADVYFHVTQGSQSLPQSGTCPGYVAGNPPADPPVVPDPPAVTAPTVPTNFRMGTNTGVYRVLLCWDPVADATSYDARYQIRGQSNTNDGNTAFTRYGWESMAITRNQVIDFYVRAKNTGGDSAWAGPLTRTVGIGNQLPTVDNPTCRDNS